MASITSSKSEEFAVLQAEGKKLAAEGKLVESLKKFEQAKLICPTPKVLQRIEKLKACMQSIGMTAECNFPSTSSVSEEVKPFENSKTPLKSKNSFVGSNLKGDKNVERNEYLESTNDLAKIPGSYISNKSKKLFSMKDGDPPFNSENKSDVRQDSNEHLHSADSAENVLGQSSIHDFENDEMEQKRIKVRALYEKARDFAATGKLQDALDFLKQAQSIYETEKVQKKINKINEILEDETKSDDRIRITDDFFVYHEVYNALYPYQREGVAWLYKLFKKRKGGILADDMGLGKTFQIIAFLSGMIDADLVKHVLIIMPVSLLTNWAREFKKWCPGIAVQEFHGGSKKIRERNLLRVQKRGHVLLTTYGMVMSNIDVFTTQDGRDFVWDYVILDEGHKIKNATKTTKAIYELPSMNRIVLTGTPIQNNLKELWSLFDFAHQGTLLGSLRTFHQQYEYPIVRSREKDATSGEKKLGSEISENLKDLINPYFIRRTKKEIWGENNEEIDKLGKQLGNMAISMPKKNDFILWTILSEQQIEIYTSFLHSSAVKEILVSKRSPLVELTVLKKICDHPRLLSQRACMHLGLDDELNENIIDDELSEAPSIDSVSDELLLKESGKLKLVIDLLEHLKETGHRSLFFSLSRKILDMVQRILMNRQFKVMRLDGTVSRTEERERRIQRFQNDSSYSVFLLTTQVGGVGLNLTAADRVIIYDPSWNPATDAQAVDRVFRIGQNKDVVIYRLITCATVEEKIYRRQIFKESITRQTTGSSDPYRYFSKQELRELFLLGDPYRSDTQIQLHELHSAERNASETLLRHITFLKTLNIFGISDHDLMFSKEIQDNSEDNDANAISQDFIKQKVAAAHNLIQKEASVVAEGLNLAGTFNRPYQLVVKDIKKVSKVDLYKPPIMPEEIDLTENDENTNTLNISSTKIQLEKKQEIDIAENEHTINISYTNTPFQESPQEIDLIECEKSSEGEHEEYSTPAQTPVSEGKFKSLIENLPDLCLDTQMKESHMRKGRVSCARPSDAFATDSEDTNSSVDSSNSASLSLVPNSATNSPKYFKISKTLDSVAETPPQAVPSASELLSGYTSEGFFEKI